ncbi:hypothetical protein [Thermus tengchongensis]|uniref:hypothetical protein n=1 Tax=Thermus tengchongensis TaxID=1214928 RepID=UPI001F33F2E2|nr:hypothetical protein [Thermus tengchongensis]
MFNLLGVKPDELIAQAQGAVKALDERLACVEDRLAAIQRTLEYEYGRPRRDVAGHDPARLPLIAQIPAGDTPHRLELVGLLGKPATRGHLVNIGDSKARIWFTLGSSRVGPYVLLPAAALDLSFIVDGVEIADAGEGPTTLQVLFQ